MTVEHSEEVADVVVVVGVGVGVVVVAIIELVTDRDPETDGQSSGLGHSAMRASRVGQLSIERQEEGCRSCCQGRRRYPSRYRRLLPRSSQDHGRRSSRSIVFKSRWRNVARG